MINAPLVSIIIAAFNAERHIGAALDSALAQTGVSIEVVVADDASTDATVAVVETIDDPRVRLVRLERNGGPGAARNAAMQTARGDWFSVLDADDHMAPGRTAVLLATAREGGADIVADNLYVERDGKRRLFIEETLDGGVDRLDLAHYARHNRLFVRGRGYGYLKPLFRADFLREHALAYDPRVRIGEDFQLVAEMLVRGAVYLRRRSADYVYVGHANSISHRLGARDAEAMADADRRFLIDHANALPPQALAAMRAHLRSVEDGAAFAHIVEALKNRRWAAAVSQAMLRPAAVRHLGMPLLARLGRMTKTPDNSGPSLVG
jgi:succinoglycan biosynthesis protein ExoO